MNATGLNIIKTLGCMTAVTFFTIYNTWDHYDYDYHWILGFLTFILDHRHAAVFCRCGLSRRTIPARHPLAAG
jgi:hypothetical protein